MKKINVKQILCLIVLLLGVGFQTLPVAAEAFVGMTSPDTVTRGQSFKVAISATGATAGVEALQLYLQYDPNLFTFNKANSTVLETAGSEMQEGNMQRVLKENNGVVIVLASIQPFTPGTEVVAELEFVAKADAAIGPASFLFLQSPQESFVQVTGVGKVAATGIPLSLELIEPDIAGQAQKEPYPPTEVETPATAQSESLGESFNSDNQIAPVDEEVGEASNYNVGEINAGGESVNATAQGASLDSSSTSESIPESTPSTTPSTKPTVPPAHKASATESESKKANLRSITQELLTVPKEKLKPNDIPKGYIGDTGEVQGVMIPIIRDQERKEIYYYLQGKEGPQFYSLESSGLFRPHKFEEEKESTEKTEPTQSAFTRQAGNSWYLPLLGGLAVLSFAVMAYTYARNTRRG